MSHRAADPAARIEGNGKLLAETIEKAGISHVIDHFIDLYHADEIAEAARIRGATVPKRITRKTAVELLKSTA